MPDRIADSLKNSVLDFFAAILPESAAALLGVFCGGACFRSFPETCSSS